jgi:hypothetical protein
MVYLNTRFVLAMNVYLLPDDDHVNQTSDRESEGSGYQINTIPRFY